MDTALHTGHSRISLMPFSSPMKVVEFGGDEATLEPLLEFGARAASPAAGSIAAQDLPPRGAAAASGTSERLRACATLCFCYPTPCASSLMPRASN